MLQWSRQRKRPPRQLHRSSHRWHFIPSMSSSFVSARSGTAVRAGVRSGAVAPLLQGCDENGVPYTSSVDALKRARGPISGICADAARARLAGLLRESGVASLYTGLRSKLLMDIIRTVSFHYTFTALKEVIPRRSIQIARASFRRAFAEGAKYDRRRTSPDRFQLA